MIISRPTYGALRIDPVGRAHLLVCDRMTPPVLEGRAVETWLVSGDSRSAQEPGASILFRAVPQLLARLRHRLAEERIGLRLYAAGEEAFLWDVAALAGSAGMSREEFSLMQLGGVSRRVHCIHCGTSMERVTTSIVRCSGCHATLMVRDHFSKRLGAFMGVQADAEVPGEHEAAAALSS